ncbi:MAG: plasmid-related protein [Sulfuricaulis sp.]|jgi:hypothetical protein
MSRKPLDVPLAVTSQLPFESAELELKWSEEDVAKLREGILIEALRDALDNRVAPEQRAKIWKWIDSDDIGPFSFRICAEAGGHDYLRLRETFHATARRQRGKGGQQNIA